MTPFEGSIAASNRGQQMIAAGLARASPGSASGLRPLPREV